MMKTKKDDTVEIEFVARLKDTGEIFGTNIKEEAEKINLKIELKPLVVQIGKGMLVRGFDKALEGKEIGRKYKISLAPEQAFGMRKKELVKIIPLSVFKEKNFNPAPGMTLALDNLLAKIITISGGRVIVDFNNPLANKEVEYEFTIKKKIQKEDKTRLKKNEAIAKKKGKSDELSDKKHIKTK